jgi:hypothetical protein
MYCIPCLTLHRTCIETLDHESQPFSSVLVVDVPLIQSVVDLALNHPSLG